MARLGPDDIQRIRDLGKQLAEDHHWEALGMDLRQVLADHDVPCDERAERELLAELMWLLG